MNNKYLIALRTGGEQGSPGIDYYDFEIIEAESRKAATDIYNQKHKCNYYYGTCMAENVDGKLNIVNEDVTYRQAKTLL